MTYLCLSTLEELSQKTTTQQKHISQLFEKCNTTKKQRLPDAGDDNYNCDDDDDRQGRVVCILLCLLDCVFRRICVSGNES